MGEVLSQGEIDALLKALSEGDLNVDDVQSTTEVKVREYDFKRPNKFAKDHLRTLHNIFESYARLVTTFLSGYLRTLITMDISSVEEVSYYEFNNSISNPSVLAIIDFLPLKGYIMMDINPSVVFVTVDRILGGRGATLEKIRTFTDIENAIVEKLINQMLILLKEPFENVVDLRPRLDRIENSSQFAQIISPNEMVALVTSEIRIGNVNGVINFCIPYMVLEPVVSKLSTRYWFNSVEKELTPENKRNIDNKIQSTQVPITAVLGRSHILVSDFVELQKGDVIQLDSNINSNVEVLVGNILKFYAKPGVRKNNVAIKIAQVIHEEENR